MTSFETSFIALQLLLAMGPMKPDSDSSNRCSTDPPPNVNTTSKLTNFGPETDEEQILFKPRWTEPQDPNVTQSDTSSPLINVIYPAEKQGLSSSSTRANFRPSFPTPPSQMSSNKMLPISPEENSFKNPALEHAFIEINAMAAESPEARRAFEAAAREDREGRSMSWGRLYLPHPRNLSVSDRTSASTATSDSAVIPPTRSFSPDIVSSTGNCRKDTNRPSRFDRVRSTERSASDTDVDHHQPRKSQAKRRMTGPENTVAVNQEYKPNGSNKVSLTESGVSTHRLRSLCPSTASDGEFYACDGCRRTFDNTDDLKAHHALTGHNGKVLCRVRTQKDDNISPSRSRNGEGTLYVPPVFHRKRTSKGRTSPARGTGASDGKYCCCPAPRRVPVTKQS